MAENDSSNFGSLLFGIAVGLVLGFLYAPRPGEETRDLIADRARDGMVCATDVVDGLKLQVESGFLNAGEAVQHMRERVGDTVAEAREKLHEAVQAGQDAYRNELRERQAELDTPIPPRSRTAGSAS